MDRTFVELWLGGKWEAVEYLAQAPFKECTPVRLDPRASSDELMRLLEEWLRTPGVLWVRVFDGLEYAFAPGAAGPFRLNPEAPK